MTLDEITLARIKAVRRAFREFELAIGPPVVASDPLLSRLKEAIGDLSAPVDNDGVPQS